MSDEFDYRSCHKDEYDDNFHDCQDYIECDECPYFYDYDDYDD